MICQFTGQPCQFVNCPLWDDKIQRCLFVLAVYRILGRAIVDLDRPRILTATQEDILRLIALGHHNGEIAEILFIKPKDVGRSVADIMVRLDAKNRAHAVTIAVARGIISLDEVVPCPS